MKPTPPKIPDTDVALLALPARRRLAHGLRDFARAVRHIHDLNTFLEIFQVGLEKTGLCQQADFCAQPPDATGHRPEAFTPGRVSIPVTSGTEIVAVGQVSPPENRQHFGPEDLQALAGLSELLGAAMDVAQRLQSSDRAVTALKAVLSFAPVGICAFDEQGRIMAVNTLARGWLAVAEGDAIAGALPAGMSLEEIRRGASFHLRVSGRLLFCEARPQPESRCTALVVSDLTPEQGRLLDALNREVYRASHLRRPLQFVLLEQAQPVGALLGALPALRTALGPDTIVGPYDASRIGLIFPECSWSAAVVRLRRAKQALAAAGDVRVGRAELVRFDETPEAIITTALELSATLAEFVRPRILVQDEYRGVGDALRLVLGGACEVTGCTDPTEARRLVEQQHFDAVLVELNAGGGGTELVATARERNRDVRPFYLSSVLPRAMSGRPHAGGVPVFSKPFDVEFVRDRILAALEPGGAGMQK